MRDEYEGEEKHLTTLFFPIGVELVRGCVGVLRVSGFM